MIRVHTLDYQLLLKTFRENLRGSNCNSVFKQCMPEFRFIQEVIVIRNQELYSAPNRAIDNLIVTRIST